MYVCMYVCHNLVDWNPAPELFWFTWTKDPPAAESATWVPKPWRSWIRGGDKWNNRNDAVKCIALLQNEKHTLIPIKRQSISRLQKQVLVRSEPWQVRVPCIVPSFAIACDCWSERPHVTSPLRWRTLNDTMLPASACHIGERMLNVYIRDIHTAKRRCFATHPCRQHQSCCQALTLARTSTHPPKNPKIIKLP